ncbi:hypothetical protein GWK47_041295 [Chionoecetes opilio]|uniref:Uncharacterized protein n=1 Tax=Chionoecetes opilio TaxID=41210 RepID=A0A8J4YA21_CHIOP|nr:hypothetical protein GWK47_041295 [Chionoecetes opilio]
MILGDILRPKRSSLSNINFEQLVFVRGNMHLLGYKEMEDLINFSENGEEGLDQEIRKEEVVTPKEDDTSPENYERLDRMIQLEQEVERTKMALELLLRDKGGEKDVRRPVRSLVKPRDIRMLNLSDLQGIEAGGRLKVFFSQVESCSEDFEERKRILMARVDPPLALYIQNTLSKINFK